MFCQIWVWVLLKESKGQYSDLLIGLLWPVMEEGALCLHAEGSASFSTTATAHVNSLPLEVLFIFHSIYLSFFFILE